MSLRDVTAVSLLMSRCTSQPFETLEPARHVVPTGASLVHQWLSRYRRL